MKKKVKKRSIVAILMLLVTCLTLIPAGAVNVESGSVDEIQPRYTGAYNASAELEISSSGYANAKSSVRVSSGYTASLKMELKRTSDDHTIAYWSTSGSGALSLDRGCYVSSGYTYYTYVTVYVYNSAGTHVDTITSSSSTRSY